MNLEELKKFCNPNSYSRMPLSPFSYGNYTYATDAAIMVRVPRIEVVPFLSTKEAEGFDKMIADFNNEVDEWFNIPKVEYLEVPCTNCNGTGEMYTCPECQGSRFVEFSTDFNYYGRKDCQTCDGYGAIKNKSNLPHWVKDLQKESCEECNSTGIGTNKTSLTEIEGKKFYTYIIAKVCDLEEVEIGFPKEDSKPCLIRFNYGEAIIVPIRDKF